MNASSLSQTDLDAIRAAILPAVRTALRGVVEQATLPTGINPLTEAQKQQVVDSFIEVDPYSNLLGEYILTQNPYAALADIDPINLPKLANGSLDPNAEIPPGGIWDRPNHPYAPPDVLKAGVLKAYHSGSGSTLDVNVPVPFGTILPVGIMTGKNDMYMDHHNIVKMLVIRYKLRNRQKPNPNTGSGQPATVPSNAYLIVCYSGGDSG